MKLMAPCANVITTALETTAKQFSQRKTRWLGNPARDLTCKNIEEARNFFGIKPGTRVIFALGGGTGSMTVNRLILEALPSWPKEWQVIHLIGKERPGDLSERAAKTFPNYHVYPFFTHEMAYAYALAPACDSGRARREDAAGCVLFAAERGTQVALQAIQALGGNGYTNDFPAGRLLRDAKLYEIGGGTQEIRRMLIGRQLFEDCA